MGIPMPHDLPACRPALPFVTIVSGLPRSGTSLMMQMLRAGGMSVVCDEQRQADLNNPQGYFESACLPGFFAEPVPFKSLQGRAVKVVFPLVLQIPENCPVRILFMQRDLAEILLSQRNMLHRLGLPGALVSDTQMAAYWARELKTGLRKLDERSHISVLELTFREVLNEPRRAAEMVCQFLTAELDQGQMASMVDARLYRSQISA